MKGLFLALLLFTTAARAQDHVVLSLYDWTPTLTIANPWDVNVEDSVCATIAPYSWIESSAVPGMDSIGFIGSIPDSVEIAVGVAHLSQTQDEIGRFKGPLPYGRYMVRFREPSLGAANYVFVEAPTAKEDHTPNYGYALIDALIAVQVKDGVSCQGLLDSSKPKRWYNELGIEDSVHGVIRH